MGRKLTARLIAPDVLTKGQDTLLSTLVGTDLRSWLDRADPDDLVDLMDLADKLGNLAYTAWRRRHDFGRSRRTYTERTWFPSGERADRVWVDEPWEWSPSGSVDEALKDAVRESVREAMRKGWTVRGDGRHG